MVEMSLSLKECSLSLRQANWWVLSTKSSSPMLCHAYMWRMLSFSDIQLVALLHQTAQTTLLCLPQYFVLGMNKLLSQCVGIFEAYRNAVFVTDPPELFRYSRQEGNNNTVMLVVLFFVSWGSWQRLSWGAASSLYFPVVFLLLLTFCCFRYLLTPLF